MLALLAQGAELDRPEVVLSGARWRALVGPELPAIEDPGPRVVDRTVRLSKTEKGLRIEARWRLDAERGGWFVAPLVGDDVVLTSLTWRGRAEGLGPPSAGMRPVALWVDGPGELVLTGILEARVAPGEGPLLPMLAAPTGRGELPEDWVFASEGMAPTGKGSWWGGTGDLALVGRQPAATARGALLGATVATGITVDDGAVTVAARLHVTALRGTMAQVVFRVAGAGPDLSVVGPQVASFDRQGDRVTVTLRDGASTSARLEVRWSASTATGAATSLPAPSVVPEGVSRTAYVTKLARSGDREVVPDGDAWRAVALAELPDWAEGLVEGTATGALSYAGTGRGPAGLRLNLLRFEPVPGPATLIDVAQTAVALSDEGRMLMRTHLQVRNDRGGLLRVTPPPGARIIGVSVAGELPEPLVDGRSWRLPLKKSVETVDGLLSFPVRVVMVGDAPAFDGRTRDALPLPSFDADIAVHRVTVNLPMGHESRLKDDEQHVVPSFTEGSGITYGFAVGDARATEADVLFQNAVQQWMANDFDGAQGSLDQLRSIGAGNDDMDRLQGNLDLLFTESKQESATSRRVKEQAKYRSMEESREQQRLLDEAEQALLVGDYEVAQSNYSQALDIGDKLEKLDADEDKSNVFKNAELKQKLTSTSTLSKQKKKAQSDATAAARQAEERRRAEEMSRRQAEDERKLAEAEAARRYEEDNRRRAQVVEKAKQEAEVAAQAAADAAAYETALLNEPEPYPEPEVAQERVTISMDRIEIKAEPGLVTGSRQAAEVVHGTDQDDSGVVYKERTEIDFEAVEISGELVAPQGQLVTEPTSATVPLDRGSKREPSRPRPKPRPRPSAPPEEPDVAIQFGRDKPLDGPAPAASPAPPPTLPPPNTVVDVSEAVDTSDTSRSSVLSKDFLEKVPSGRSYQNAVSTAAGVGTNPNMAGGAVNDNTPVLDAPADAELDGVEGFVPGGVVGGVVGGVLGGELATVSASGAVALGSTGKGQGGGGYALDGANISDEVYGTTAADEAPMPVEEEWEEEDSYEPASVNAEVVKRSGGIRLPKVPKIGGGKKKAAKAAPARPEYVEIDIDADDVVGELVEPEGALLLDRKKASFGDSERRRDRREKAEAKPQQPAETIEIAMGGEDDPPDVKATSLDVIVPAQGETVRYQHLLVPAGEAVQVPIHTRPQRSRRNR